MENKTKFKSRFEQGYSVYKVDILPARDTKLLAKLLKTRAEYDETRRQILTNSLTCVNNSKPKPKKNKNPCDYQKVKAIVNLVTSVDKGADLANVKNNIKNNIKNNRVNCCDKPESYIRLRNKATQVKQVKSGYDQDKKQLHRVCSDPCKMGMVQRNRCRTTCIQVQMVDCPKQNLQTLISQMCKPVKVSACCKPSKTKCIKDNSRNKTRVKMKNACTKTSSSKTRTTKSEANIKVKKCCSRPRRDWTQNSLIVNFLRKRGSHKCCKASKPDVTQVTNIFCCNKTKPCSTHVVEHHSEHKKCSNTKIQLKKKGTQPRSKPCCAVQWKPNKSKPPHSYRSNSSSRKKAKKDRNVSKKGSKCGKKRPPTPKRSQCKCDKYIQTKICKDRPKNDKCPKNIPSHDSNCACCKPCKNNRFYHSMLKVKKGCTQQIVRSYSVICKTTRPCCPEDKSSPVSKSRKINTVRSKAKMKKIQSNEKAKKEKKEAPPCQQSKPKKFKPVRRGLRISSNCCIDIEFYRERPRKVKAEKEKKCLVDNAKKVNKSTKTRPTCCSLCYFVEIYRRKPEPVITDSSSTGTFTSSALSSRDNASTSSSCFDNINYRTIQFDDYSPPCEKLLAFGRQKLSDPQFQNDLCAHGTTLTKNMLKKGLFTKFCSATTFNEECPLRLLRNHCAETKHNVFFRKLGQKLFRDLTAFVYLPEKLYATEQKVKHFCSKSDILKYGVSCFGKCCNRVLLMLLKEMDSLRASLQTYCRILFWA